jgi:hypothetical protein
MALECLCEPRDRPPAVQAAVRAADDAFSRAVAEAAGSSDDLDQLHDIRQLLSFKTRDTIRSQLRRLVREELSASDTLEADVRLVGRLYDMRSKLAHYGHLDWPSLGDLPERAKDLVRRLLSARLTRMVRAGAGAGVA